MVGPMSHSIPLRHRIAGAGLLAALAFGALVPVALAQRARTERVSDAQSFTCMATSLSPKGTTPGSVQATFTRRGDRFQALVRTSSFMLSGLPKGRYTFTLNTQVYAQGSAAQPVRVGARNRTMRVRVIRDGRPAMIRRTTMRFSGRVAGLGAQPQLNAMAVVSLRGQIPGGLLDCSGTASVNGAKTWQ